MDGVWGPVRDGKKKELRVKKQILGAWLPRSKKSWFWNSILESESGMNYGHKNSFLKTTINVSVLPLDFQVFAQ
jgi:hypothetical protein